MKTQREIYELLVNKLCPAKTQLTFTQMAWLGILAGFFIGLGAVYAMTVMSGVETFGLKKLLGGIVFSVGLMLVIIAGAELFTGNVLMTISLYAKKITLRSMLKNWITVYFFNLIGSLILAWIMLETHLWGNSTNLSLFGETALKIAQTKANLTFSEAFFRGILCNILVDLAVILAIGADTITGKILGILFPISAFVASGFEHSIANMFFIPFGLMIKGSINSNLAELYTPLTMNGAIKNIFAVTLGNIVGPMVFITLPYYFSYIRNRK